MQITEEAFKFFLYETHLVQKTISFANAIAEMDEETKRKRSLENNLNELFLFRMDRDPGFQQFVLKSIIENNKIINRTLNYVDKLFFECTCDIDDFYHQNREAITKEEKKSLETTINKQIEYYKQDFITFITSIDHVNSIDFFTFLHSQAFRDQDDVATSAIQTIINLLQAHHVFGKMPFIENIHSVEKLFNKKRDKESKFYVYRNLKFADYYADPQKMDYEIPLLRCVAFQKDTRDSIANKFNILIPDHPWIEKKVFLKLKPEKQHEFIRYIRFTNDFLFIASEFWFATKSEQEKINILNQEYQFDIIEQDLNNLSVEEIDAHANTLCDRQYFDYASKLFKHCISRSKSDADSFFFHDDTAYCYKNMGEYSRAKKHYRSAYNIISNQSQKKNLNKHLSYNIRQSSSSYDFLLLMKKKYLAEMDYHLGNDQNADTLMSEVLSEIEILDDHEKPLFLREIAISYHNTLRIKEEYDILRTILDQKDLDPLLWSDINQRMVVLDNCLDLSGHFNIQKVKNMALFQDISSNISKIEAINNSFQFTRSFEIIESVYENNLKTMSSEKEPLCFLAMGYFQIQNYKKASEYFEKYSKTCIKNYDYVSPYAGYIGTCLIFEGKENEGICALQNEIISFASFLNKEEMEKAIGCLLNTIAKELFWFKKEGIEKIIDKITPTIEKHVPIEKSTYFIASAYISICWFEKAIETLDRLLNETDFVENDRALLLSRKGDIYLDSCDFDSALKCYHEASESYYFSFPTHRRAMLMHKMAEAHIENMNILEARKCLDTACKTFQNLDETDPDYIQIQKLQQSVQYFLNERLSLDSVKCETARFAFNTAEREALDLYRKIGNNVEFDFSPPLGYYGKGLEILLNEVVWSEIRTNVLTEFSTENEFGIPSKLYSDLSRFWKSGQLSTFPNTKKTMSLGSWAKININKDNGHPVIDSIIRQLREKFGDDYKLIKQASAFLAPYRNDVLHAVVVKDKNEVLVIRNKVIKHLHNVIEVLYGSETTEYFNDTFKKHHNDIALVDEAQKQILAGNDEGASSLLLDALKIDSNNSDALVIKAQIHIRRKEYDEARGLIEKALSIDSDDYDALHEMGVLNFEEGKYDVAADFFQKTIRIKSDHDLAWLNLGCSFMEMFDYSMAIKCLQEATKLNPDDENIIKEMEFCEGALENALTSLPKIEEKIALNPDDFNRYSVKGFLLFMLGKYSESLEWLNRAIENEDEDSGTYLLKGQALLRLNRLDEANEAFDKYNILKE